MGIPVAGDMGKKANTFYPRKIGKAGHTRTLSVGRILPPDWVMVKVSVQSLVGKECILKIERLI
ncbi:unnamed protein product [marine sediment metagenome]|uniref:Uncharacterized protein n=1 Tax=marine sediment metagenome TaxID=412755 RepID=X1USK1_9ZZZZ